MAPKRAKGKKKPAKKAAAEPETRPESHPPEQQTEDERRVEDPTGGGGDIPVKTNEGGGGDGPAGNEEEDSEDSFHDAYQGDGDEEVENEKKKKGKEDSGEEEKNEEEEEQSEEDKGGEGRQEKGKGISEGGEENQTNDQGTEDGSEELPEPMQPLKMYFSNSEFVKPIKVITRCYNYKAVENLKRILDAEELRWFEEHPQFCHFFHMPKDTNHKSMGVWLLFLRTASTLKNKEVWFVVNGVPVRYGMREHALLSGLNCKEYPTNYLQFGNYDFVKKHFKSEKATYEEIRDKFLSMTSPSPSRLQMAVLYFLTSVIKGVAKQGEGAPSVDSKLLKYVSNLEWCRNFPWGRFSFLDCFKEIKHCMDSCDGVVAKSVWCFPSFIIPLEVCKNDFFDACLVVM